MNGYFYTEEQRFRQPWIWIGIALSLFGLFPLWYGVYQQIVTGIPWGENPTSDEVLLLIAFGMTLLILGIFVLFLKSRLVFSLGSEGLDYRFVPFHWKVHTIRWEDVATADVRTYRPILEYGGWGIRFGPKGKAYNVSGTDGLQLELRNGKRILFWHSETSGTCLRSTPDQTRPSAPLNVKETSHGHAKSPAMLLARPACHTSWPALGDLLGSGPERCRS